MNGQKKLYISHRDKMIAEQQENQEATTTYNKFVDLMEKEELDFYSEIANENITKVDKMLDNYKELYGNLKNITFYLTFKTPTKVPLGLDEKLSEVEMKEVESKITLFIDELEKAKTNDGG